MMILSYDAMYVNGTFINLIIVASDKSLAYDVLIIIILY